MAKELEYRANEFGERLEEMGERLTDSLDAKHSEKSSEIRERRLRRKHNDTVFWGFSLIVVGSFWLSRNMGWLDWDLPFWPLVIIALGLFILFRGVQY